VLEHALDGPVRLAGVGRAEPGDQGRISRHPTSLGVNPDPCTGLAPTRSSGYIPFTMTGFDVVYGILISGLVAAQIWLTVKVWRNGSFERSQKILQSKLIWLVPVVGAVLVFSLMPEEEDNRQRADKELRG
jgi:hypothetical protein